MFANEERCILKKNQLAEVICQFRFPDILIINSTPPAQFQEMIRSTFPQFSVRQESTAPKVKNVNGSLQIDTPPVTNNYQFSTADNIWRVNLTKNFISLCCSRYNRWEEFAKHFDQVLAAFITTYSPAYFTRIGLRYMNFISRKDLNLDSIPYSELIKPCYLGPLGEHDTIEGNIVRNTVDTQIQLRNGCTLKIHAGPGMINRNGVADEEPKFIFDQDLFMSGNIPVQTSAGTLNALHSQAYSVFRGAIEDTLFEAMEPQEI